MARGAGKETGDRVLYGAAPRTLKVAPGPNAYQPDWPTGLSKVSFGYGDLDYETEDDYSDHDACGDGMCRCRRITNVTITDVMPSDLAYKIIQKMKIEQRNQQNDIKSFLRSKAGKQFKGESKRKIYQEYKKHATKQAKQSTRIYRPIEAQEMLTPEQAAYEFDDTDQLILEQILQDSGISADDFHADVVSGYYGDEVDGIYLEGDICTRIADSWNDYLRTRGSSRSAKISWLPTAQGKIKNSRKARVDPSKIVLPSGNPLVGEYSETYQDYYVRELQILARRRGKQPPKHQRQEEAPAAVLRSVGQGGRKHYTVVAGAAAIKGAADAGKPELSVLVIS